MRSCRAVLVVLTGAGALVLGLAGCSADPPASGATPSSSSTASTGLRIAFVGDSIMKGHGLPASEAWPELAASARGWDATNLACDGAGFLATGDSSDCGSTFAGLVAQVRGTHPQVVVVEGSSNDLGEDDGELAAETDAQLRELRAEVPHARIIGLSTIWNDTTPPAQIAATSAQVEHAVEAVHGRFVDVGQPLQGHPDWMQSDDVHPTLRGQQAIEEAVLAAFARTHVRL